MINPTILRNEDLITEIEALRERREATAYLVCGILGGIAGVIQGVVQIVFSIIGLVKVRFEDVPCSPEYCRRPNPSHHHRDVVAEDVYKEMLSSAGIMSVIFTGPLTGGFVFGIGMAVAWFFAFRPLDNLKEKIQVHEKENIQAEDFKQLLSMGDDEFIKNLLKKMDFEQLYQAHKELGDKNFKKLNENPTWNLIDQVNEENVNQFKAQFITEPYFFKAVEERASGSFKKLLNRIYTGLSTEDPKQNLIINGKDLFNYGFGLTNHMGDTYISDNEFVSKVMSEISLSEDIKKLLNGDMSVLNEQTVISLLDEADHWSLVNVVSIIDSYLNLHRKSFSEALLIDLIDLYPGLDKIRTAISRKYLINADKVPQKVLKLVLSKEDFELFDKKSIHHFLKKYWILAISSKNKKMKNNAMKVIKKEMEKELLNPSKQFNQFNSLYRQIVGVYP